MSKMQARKISEQEINIKFENVINLYYLTL
jgi:hypothetical protein